MVFSTTKQLAAVIFAAVLFAGGDVWAGTVKDGRHYFDELKALMLKVLADNQKLINALPDGNAKSDKLLPDAVYNGAYQTFKTVMGSEFSLGVLNGETDPEKIAGALTALLQASRDTIAKLQQPINTEADGSVTLKKFIPAVFGRLTLEEFRTRTGIVMK
ncbi:MAG: hypothetical protein FD149_2589 [Rhodospirillaceae bacterium]|nr:MAG: hypothetical protein FD149_2589 [Rhodospirillaceae bacterium]